jgi:cytochrome c553
LQTTRIRKHPFVDRGFDVRTEIGKWTAISAAVSLVLLVTGSTVVFAQNAQTSRNAEICTAMAWAFPLNPPPGPNAPPPDMHKPLHVPGSTRSYTLAQYDAMFGAPDWFPQDHPPMPHIVARGRKPAWACAYCHLPNGQGRPENAALAGLPAAYIIEQVKAFRSGERASGRAATAKFMPAEARNVGDVDLRLAAAYFSKLKFRPWTRVIESPTVPKTHIAHWMLAADAGGAREPIGERIVETTTDMERTELRDTRFGFIAYAPPGSIARGAVIAAKGIGAAQACESCHGADLRGVGNIPPLAGRSPTYIVRELILFQTGGRSNAGATPMRQEASHLSLRDMIAVAAYVASRKP